MSSQLLLYYTCYLCLNKLDNILRNPLVLLVINNKSIQNQLETVIILDYEPFYILLTTISLLSHVIHGRLP